MIQYTNGLLYGSAEFGGTYGYGAIYSLDLPPVPRSRSCFPPAKSGQDSRDSGPGLYWNNVGDV